MESETSPPELPMPRQGLVQEAGSGKPKLSLRGSFTRVIVVLLILVAGAFLGAYIRLPSQAVSSETGGKLQSTSASVTEPDGTAGQGEGLVFALGRLQPKGKAISVAAPFGASDARISMLLAGEGDRVAAGQTLAELDSLTSLKLAVASAQANIAAKEAALAQTRATVAASLADAEANRDRAQAAVQLATQALDRERSLSQGGASSQSTLQSAEASLAQSMSDLHKANALLVRYQSSPGSIQADIAVAERNLDLAKADLATAKDNLSKGMVVAPISGTVIAVNTRPGERPGAEGVMILGDTEHMQVELEVYQTDIRRIEPGQAVVISSPALFQPLNASVAFIGHEVEQQTVLSADPAANTDARVVRVTANLDRRSSASAARLTGLEVVGSITVGRGHE